MSWAAYLAGLGLLALALAPAVIAARSIRAALLPEWAGSSAALASAVAGIGLVTVISQLLGIAGVLTAPTLVVALWLAAAAARAPAVRALLARAGAGGAEPATASGVGGAAAAATPAEPDPPGPEPRDAWERAAVAVALALAALVVAQWSAPTLLALERGIYGGDSLWYHLPFAAHIAQTGSLTDLLYTDPLYLNWFYPQNSELLGADALLLFGNDFPAPLINLGWLGLALLAGWCAGRPRGAQAPALAAVAALMASDLMFSRQPGNANNDVAVVALVLASVAILLNLRSAGGAAGGVPRRTEPAGHGPIGRAVRSGRDLEPGGLALAALAAGLAVGVKLTAAVPVAVLTAGVVAVLPAGRRLRGATIWAGGLVLGGGYWFARNLAVSGNPLPWVDLGPVDKVSELAGRDPYPIVHYATDTDVWGEWFVPGLQERFGELWPLMLAVAVVGAVAAIAGGRPAERMLGAVVALGAIGYLLTPLGAAGEEGLPSGFRLNIRYLAPALAIGLVLAARPPVSMSEVAASRWRWSALAVFALLALVSADLLGALEGERLAGMALLTALVALPVAAAFLRGRLPAAAAAAIVVALAGVGALTGRGAADSYLENRYALDAPEYPVDRHPATELSQGLGAAFDWARRVEDERIALSGTQGALFQYGLWGLEATNEVRYLGEHGPRGSFSELGCRERLEAVGAGDYSYLVTTPDYDQDDPAASVAPAERSALAASPAVERVAGGELVDVWRLDGAPDPRLCRAAAP